MLVAREPLNMRVSGEERRQLARRSKLAPKPEYPYRASRSPTRQAHGGIHTPHDETTNFNVGLSVTNVVLKFRV